MCYMWDQRRNESARQLKFYIRRTARIAPLFWFAIVFYTLLYGTAPRPDAWNGVGPIDLILTALFLHPFSPSAINAVAPGDWSIGIEMGFYLIFPLLAALQPKRLLMFAFAAFVLLGILGTSIAERFGSGGHYSEFLYYPMLTQLPIVPIGMFIYAITLGEEKIESLHTIVIVMLWLFNSLRRQIHIRTDLQTVHVDRNWHPCSDCVARSALEHGAARSGVYRPSVLFHVSVPLRRVVFP